MAETLSKPSADDAAVRAHARYQGKIQTAAKVPVSGLEDFATWYTPGVAAAARRIHADPGALAQLTNRANTVAVVTNGTRVLGLGDIGPKAALPVMEGKALLFKYLGGVDAVPICLDAPDPEDLMATVRALAPSFGGINLEDIKQPYCFGILDRLRRDLEVPVWHDDQQGTALAVLAGLRNALDVVGKPLETARIALIGAGAANVAVYRALKAAGVDPGRVVVCDSNGVLHAGRRDIESRKTVFPDKWRICQDTNADGVTGANAEAMKGADACICFSSPGPGTLDPGWIADMADQAIVFACANPVPEIWPERAHAAGAAIVATGRGDFDNQVNNALAFPGVFRGVIDVGARSISDGMLLAGADALAQLGRVRGLSARSILPRLDDLEVPVEVAAAVGERAIAEGLAAETADGRRLRHRAEATINRAHRAIAALAQSGAVAPVEV